jgi:hypothetical protein
MSIGPKWPEMNSATFGLEWDPKVVHATTSLCACQGGGTGAKVTYLSLSFSHLDEQSSSTSGTARKLLGSCSEAGQKLTMRLKGSRLETNQEARRKLQGSYLEADMQLEGN